MALFTLAGVLGGVVVTGLITLWTAALNHRWQSQDTERRRLETHNTLVRQERRESYAAYWLAWNRFVHELRRVEEVVPRSQICPGRWGRPESGHLGGQPVCSSGPSFRSAPSTPRQPTQASGTLRTIVGGESTLLAPVVLIAWFA